MFTQEKFRYGELRAIFNPHVPAAKLADIYFKIEENDLKNSEKCEKHIRIGHS